MCAVAYSLLARSLTSDRPKNALLADAIGDDRKGKLSIVLYLAGIALSWLSEWAGLATYISVSVMWLVPDRRIEEKVVEEIEKEEAAASSSNDTP